MTECLRVLIVEDEAVVLMHLEMLLEDAGHVIVGKAMSAKEAIEKIRETQPELVLLDLQLSGGSSGREVARAVRGQDDLTIVFVTANVLKLDDDMDGAVGVIAKPFNDDQLEGSLAFLEQGLHRPPPLLDKPARLRLAPAYLARLEGLRSAT